MRFTLLREQSPDRTRRTKARQVHSAQVAQRFAGDGDPAYSRARGWCASRAGSGHTETEVIGQLLWDGAGLGVLFTHRPDLRLHNDQEGVWRPFSHVKSVVKDPGLAIVF